MKRFYREARCAPVAGGYGVALDGKPVRTPAGRPLAVPGAALAEALAGEWAAQGERVRREAMPLTRLVCTALDRLPAARPDTVAAVARYAETDLVCYRAAAPPVLAARQEAAWQPLVEWAAERYGARLAVTTGLRPVPQAPAALAALRAAVAALDDLALAGLGFATGALGSLVVALALRCGRLDAAAAADAALVDERYQMERWGADPELAERCRRLTDDVAAAARLFRLLAAGGPAPK